MCASYITRVISLELWTNFYWETARKLFHNLVFSSLVVCLHSAAVRSKMSKQIYFLTTALKTMDDDYRNDTNLYDCQSDDDEGEVQLFYRFL